MTKQQAALVLDLALNRIDQAQFLTRFAVDREHIGPYLHAELSKAILARDKDCVEYVMILAFRFAQLSSIADLMLQLCFEDWHTGHEDIASAFQTLKDPRSVEGLYRMATTAYPYLDYDDAYALAVKCVWALYAINTQESVEMLRRLARSNNSIISQNALQRLGALGC